MALKPKLELDKFYGTKSSEYILYQTKFSDKQYQTLKLSRFRSSFLKRQHLEDSNPTSLTYSYKTGLSDGQLCLHSAIDTVFTI